MSPNYLILVPFRTDPVPRGQKAEGRGRDLEGCKNLCEEGENRYDDCVYVGFISFDGVDPAFALRGYGGQAVLRHWAFDVHRHLECRILCLISGPVSVVRRLSSSIHPTPP